MIAIVDYGMGNLRSVQKAFEKVGHPAVITSDPVELIAARKVVLPGVGAFGDAMHELRKRDLITPILDVVESGKPFLGICLGMQLLFEVGYEGGTHAGLGIIAGECRRFDLPPEFKVPHMGWNRLQKRSPSPMLAGIEEGTHVYFVHSYYVAPTDHAVIATETDYGGAFCSMLWRDNVYATQFHPEKSQSDGLRLLKNFAEISPGAANVQAGRSRRSAG